MSQEAVPPEQSQTGSQSRTRPWLRGVGWLLVVTAFLLAFYLIVGLLGWQSGQKGLVAAEATAVADELAKQIELAEADIGDGRYALAQERLNWVLMRDPDNNAAQSLQQAAQSGFNQRLTPQPAATATAEPTPTVTPTPVTIANDPEAVYSDIEQLLEDEAWLEVLPIITAFQRQFPAYERPTTNQWLYDTYIQLALPLLEGDQVELGMYYLSQAQRLGDLPTAMVDYETWAELYLQGIAFYGTNWAASAYYFRDLCLAAPFYQDSCDRLQEILIAYADQYAVAQDWCPAQLLYEEARRNQVSPGLPQKLEQAVSGCLSATPTASVITNTVPLTQTGILTDAQPFVLPEVTPETP